MYKMYGRHHDLIYSYWMSVSQMTRDTYVPIPVLSSFMNDHPIFNMSNKLGATSRTWIAFHSEALEFNAIFSGVCDSVFSISSIYVVLCGPLLSSFMNYHMNFNISYRPDATSGAWIALHSGALEFNAIFSGVCVVQSLSLVFM
jgi:hypothetical protein